MELRNAAGSFICVCQSTLVSSIFILVDRTVAQKHCEAKVTARNGINEDFYIERFIEELSNGRLRKVWIAVTLQSSTL